MLNVPHAGRLPTAHAITEGARYDGGPVRARNKPADQTYPFEEQR